MTREIFSLLPPSGLFGDAVISQSFSEDAPKIKRSASLMKLWPAYKQSLLFALPPSLPALPFLLLLPWMALRNKVQAFASGSIF